MARAVVTIQAAWRMHRQKKVYRLHRQSKAALVIQSYVRMTRQRSRFRQATSGVYMSREWMALLINRFPC